jgi:integrase
MGLAAAREQARNLLATLETGGDPRAQPATVGTVEELLAAWLSHQQERGRRRLADIERAIRGNCAAILARPANSITAGDIRLIIAAVHQRGSRVMANRLRAHLHTLWRYGIQHDHDPRQLHQPVRFGLEINPVAAIPRDPDAEQPGERALSWAEVREVWDTKRLTIPARQAIRLLLFSGGRVNEVVQSRWDEFDLDAGLWTLPAERSKTHRTLLTPLTPLAVELLNELRDISPDIFLFPARNVPGAAQPWGNSALSHAVRKAGFSWIPRDLRRTWKSLCGECGVSKELRDRIQNHSMADVSSRHYDKYSYLPEKRAALLRWERELRSRLAGDNVRALRVG